MVQIETSDTYERGRPKEKGLSDLRLGTLDRGSKCTTDGMGSVDCPGYFGHLELAKPVFHVGFMTTILKVLRCVSVGSSKLLLERVRSSVTSRCTVFDSPCRSRSIFLCTNCFLSLLSSFFFTERPEVLGAAANQEAESPPSRIRRCVQGEDSVPRDSAAAAFVPTGGWEDLRRVQRAGGRC